VEQPKWLWITLISGGKGGRVAILKMGQICRFAAIIACGVIFDAGHQFTQPDSLKLQQRSARLFVGFHHTINS